ncbi:MAG TPA: prolipoprotein diacylglyceryl transferase family protein [Desulfomonilaceae bacterium]|nr:prolipoprotein diacylglyceryl transferase family protein [Desulfomonilaceae bacterium]
MLDELFGLGLAISFGTLLAWAFRTLPKERWQILAAIPVGKEGAGNWKGVNLTYYGLFSAFATVSAVAILFVLMAAIQVPAQVTLVMVGILFGICFPAAKIIARLVEQKPGTFTIGGASFVGYLLAPGIVWIAGGGYLFPEIRIPVLPGLATLAVAYALGEGLGRLACISFGCCYGKPLAQCHAWIRRALGPHSFVFTGEVKKIAYERGLAGQRVVPIQALTSILYITVALAGILLFLKNSYSCALIVTTLVTQSWRVLSEFLRADHRGGGKLSAYQIMAMAAVAYSFMILFIFTGEPLPIADLKTGLVSLWDPAVLLFLQCIGLATFLVTGRSMVTASTLSFHLVKELT